MNFIEWELSRGAEIDEDITTSYNLNRTCFYPLPGYIYIVNLPPHLFMYECKYISC